MSVKITKGINGLAKRLISVFLVLVVSSLMFLTSPAVAANSSIETLNRDNFGTEVLKSDKPVVVIIASNDTIGAFGISLEGLKSEAQKTFGDKYKIVTGTLQDNPEIYYTTPAPLIYPPVTKILAYKKGELIDSRFFVGPKSAEVFKSTKDELENS